VLKQLELTDDEYEWLLIVTLWGSEITKMLQGTATNGSMFRLSGNLSPDKDWGSVQAGFYDRVRRC